VRKLLPYFLILIKITAALLASLSIAALAAVSVLGLPAKEQSPKDYVNGICQKVKSSVDAHLPCPDEFGDGMERPSNRKALWSVIRTLCIPASYVGISFPCLRTDRAGGYAVIRAPSRSRLDLIIAPTTFIEGMESLYRLKTAPPNLWNAGWISRDLLTAAAGRKLAWDEIILAVNSKTTRSQDHLHIHLGCIDRKLQNFIATEALSTASDWRIAPTEIIRPGVFIKFLNRDAINSDPFDIIKKEIPGSEKFATEQTIALAGVTRGSFQGFALIVTLVPVAAERFLAPNC